MYAIPSDPHACRITISTRKLDFPTTRRFFDRQGQPTVRYVTIFAYLMLNHANIHKENFFADKIIVYDSAPED